nr:unnamed protein product [Callosobruchus chinensis]
MEFFRSALLQLQVCEDRLKNLERAANLIQQAKHLEAKLVALPECFNSPYGTKFFEEYAETIPNGPTCDMLSKAAKENNIFLVGGTFPEKDNNKFYNTCTVWNPDGQLIAKYRKMHLFDIDLEITSGQNIIEMNFRFQGIKVGLGICYDLRFEELAKLYRLMAVNY